MGSKVDALSGFYPNLQKDVSVNAQWSQKIHFSLIFINLSLLVISAFSTKFKIPYFDFKYSQTCFLVLGFMILIYLGVKKPERSWYAGRSLSETIKTLSWRYCFLAAPFGNSENTDAELLAERIKESCIESNLIDGVSSGYKASMLPTPEMQRVRQLSLDDRADFYISKRVGGQLRWYLGRAKKNKILSQFVFSLLCVANLVAVLLSFVNELNSSTELPTDLLIALSSSLVAWVQTKKYVELTAAYELTAYEIDRARSLVHSISSFAELELFVEEMESLFSREHTQWIAKRSA